MGGLKNRAEQNANRTRTISDPRHPAEEQEDHEATHAQNRLVYFVCASERCRDDTLPKYHRGQKLAKLIIFELKLAIS